MTDFKTQLCGWQDLQAACRHNTDFSKLLDRYRQSLGSEAPDATQIVRVQAKYGAAIARDGRFKWDALEAARAKDTPVINWPNYRYADIPVCIVSKGTFEVWTERKTLVGKSKNKGKPEAKYDNLTVPHFVAQKGDLLGLFETLSPLHPPAWNVTSGVRSVFFSPPVGDKKKLKAFFSELSPVNDRVRMLVKAYKLDQKLEILLSDHSLIIQELLRRCSIDEWCSELLIFGSDFLGSLGFDLANLPALVNPTRVADLLKTYTITQLADALQVHLSVSHDSDGHSFTAERSAARLVAMANSATPVFAPVAKTENDLLPAQKLSKIFRSTPIHNPDNHHFMLFAPQSLQRSTYGYFSLHIPFADFDWKRPITDECLIEVADKLEEHKEALRGTEVRFISLVGSSNEGSVKIMPLRDSCFMKESDKVCLAASEKLLRNRHIIETPLSNPFFAYLVELQKPTEAE